MTNFEYNIEQKVLAMRNSGKPVNRSFFWKDKTGRGETGTMTASNLMQEKNKKDYSGQSLHSFASFAEIGDTWESSTESYTRIK